jgi:hypothetical protein
MIEFVKRLEKHPHLKVRMEALLNLAENTSGNFDKADDVEDELCREVQKMGNQILQSWALNQEQKQVSSAQINDSNLIKHSKKNFIGKQNLAKWQY